MLYALILFASIVLRPSASIPVHGTLVMAIPTNSGWTVCADRRRHDIVRGYQDAVTKLKRYGRNAIYADIGSSILFVSDQRATPGTVRETFNANETLKRFALTNHFSDTPRFWSMLAGVVVNDLKTAIAANRPVAGENSDLALVFFWVREGVLNRHFIRIDFSNPERITPTESRYESRPGQEGRTGAFGNSHLFAELLRGTDPRFDELRKDPDIKRFIRSPIDRQLITSGEAEAFAKRFIRISSEKTGLLLSGGGSIGPTSNCVAVTQTQSGSIR